MTVRVASWQVGGKGKRTRQAHNADCTVESEREPQHGKVKPVGKAVNERQTEF